MKCNSILDQYSDEALQAELDKRRQKREDIPECEPACRRTKQKQQCIFGSHI